MKNEVLINVSNIDLDDTELGDLTSESIPTIVVGTDIEAVANETEAALLANENIKLYQRAGTLATVYTDKDTRSPLIAVVPNALLRQMMSSSALFVKAIGDGQKNIMVPDWLPKTLLSRKEWGLPVLNGVAQAPVFRDDGTILTKPGYDPASRIFYRPNEIYPDIPEQPDAGQLGEAVEVIASVFAEFPFVSAGDLAAVFAGILSLVARSAISGPVPMFAVGATGPGTGKTLAVMLMVLIATGQAPKLTTAPSDEAETKRWIFSIGMEGVQALLIDNVGGALGTPSLAAALTATIFSDRILGSSKFVTVPLRVVWFVTSNGMTFKADLGRRVVPIELDAGTEHPEDRVFKKPDLMVDVKRRRPELVVAALTILRAYHLAGRPSHGKPLMGSFEHWDKLVRGACIWAGVGDPCENRGRIRSEGDEDLEQLRAVLGCWRNAFGSEPKTIVEAVKHSVSDADLRNALIAFAAPSRGIELNPRQLGVKFKGVKGRIASGLRLVAKGVNRTKTTLWVVEKPDA